MPMYPQDPISCEKCGKTHSNCTAHKKDGQPCGQMRMKGQRICRRHGGKAPQNLARVERDRTMVAAAEAVKTYGLPVNISPTDALLEEIRWTAGHVEWLRRKVQDLEESELTYGLSKEENGPKGETVTHKVAPNIWLDLYDRERKHLVFVCSAALKAGVDERQIRLAERQGEIIESAIERILEDLLLTPAQQAKVPEVVPRHLRALASGAA